jgi:hypothetical protein
MHHDDCNSIFIINSISTYFVGEKQSETRLDSEKAELWVPRNEVTKCFKCRVEFSPILLHRDKHHCRMCGYVH